MMVKSRSFSAILRHILKILGIVIAVIILLFVIVTWIVFEKKNVWLGNQIQSYMKESQSGQLEFKSIDLIILRNFPNVTIELDSVNYYEHRDSLRSPEEKPILHAGKLFVAFELMPLLKEELKIGIISLSKAQLNIIEYENGMLNISRALAKPSKPKPPVSDKKISTESAPSSTIKKEGVKPKPPVKAKSAIQIDLNLVSLNDVLITWNSYNTKQPYVVFIRDLEADISGNGKMLDANLNIVGEVQKASINKINLSQAELVFNADVLFDMGKKHLTIKESELTYDVFSATIQGTYAEAENRKMDLHVDASSKNLSFLSFIIKPELLKKDPDLLKNGSMYVNGKVFGELKTEPIQFDVSFGLKEVTLRLPEKIGSFQDVGFDGKFSSGKFADFSEANLEIKNLRGQLPGGFLKGQFAIKNFTNPYVSYNLNSRLKLDGYDQLFRMDFIRDLKGMVTMQANYSGLIKQITKPQMKKHRSSIIALNNLSFVVSKTNQPVTGLSGKLITRVDQTDVEQLVFTYGKNDLQINATIDNLWYLLFLKENKITATGNLLSKQFYTKDFIFDTTGNAQVQDRISNLYFDFNLVTISSKEADDTTMTDIIDFDIKNLKANLDKLPDIVMLDTRGRYGRSAGKPKLDLYNFHAVMPHGQMDLTGDMLIPKDRLLQLNARVEMNKFPWTYVKELIAEIKTDKEPAAKNLPVSEMDLITSDLDLSAEIITYPFDINKLVVRNSRAEINFPGSKTISAERIDLDFDSLKFNHPENSGSLTGVRSAIGKIELKRLSIPELNVFDVKMNVTGTEDQFNIIFSRVVQVTRMEKGNFFLDMSKEEPEYHLQYNVRHADLEYFIRRFYKKKFMSGKINNELNLYAAGSTWEKARHTISGTIEVTGDSVDLFGVEVDDVISKFQQSQNFNLTDLGAVLVAGPLGLAITKGSDFVSLARINFDSTKVTRINTMYMKWRLENRQLITEDVAVATKSNRIALDGKIDLGEKSIPGLTIAVLDKNGCSLMDQKLYGKMGALQTGKLNISKTIFGSVLNSVNAVAGKDCKPFYTGKVKNPTE